MTTQPPTSARKVAAVLRKAGLPTGARYTQTGYRDRDGNPLTGPAFDVSRLRHSRRENRWIDQGRVEAYLVGVEVPNDGTIGGGLAAQAEAERITAGYLDRAETALRDAGLPVRRGRSWVAVPDATQPTTAVPDRHGNVVAEEGCTRCACGSKYWEADRCVDCGAPASTAPRAGR